MNAELEITSAIAALRGPQAPRFDRMATGPARERNRAPAPNPTREAKRFNAPADRPVSNLRPGGARPGIARVRRPSAQAVAALGSNKMLWGGAVCLLTVAVLRAATYLGMVSGPVIVNLMWRV